MQPLNYRPGDPLAHHAQLPVRNYTEDPVQCDRIKRTHEVVQRAIQVENPRIVSLGCGSGDVEGPFAETAQVTGFDCNPEALAYARNRFPSACYSEVDIEALTPFPVDVLILTEVLEHMRDPIALVQRWFPLSQNVVITHPVNEPLDSGQSGGEHSWSYTEAELEEWLVIGGHTLEECFFYEMGGFRIGCVRGKRVLDRPL